MSRRLRLPQSKVSRAAGAGFIAAAVIAGGLGFASAGPAEDDATTTPIKHVVVLFQENTSFDHVFGTYPNAVNAPGEIPFTYQQIGATPTVNGLTPTLLTANPNGTVAIPNANPKRIAPADVIPTIGCQNSHAYTAEQRAFNGGLMDKFIQNTQGGGCGASGVMNYVDGNTVTGLWNYANHYAMSDNHYGTGFGPSTIGAIELVSGNTATAVKEDGTVLPDIPGTARNGTVFSNANPYTSFDACSGGTAYALGAVTGAAAEDAATNPSRNVGDLLNKKKVSWGWFQGGFKTTSLPGAAPACGSSHKNIAGANQFDYDAHHNPFSYYKSTANPNHLRPTGAIGSSDPANHNYDETDFDAAVAAGALPAVSFVKAAHYQDGHPGYSDPIDEQRFLVEKINAIQASPDWDSTAIFIAWDDSDGWYDHQMPPIVRSSATPEDQLSGNGVCNPPAGQPPAAKQTNGRCGFGPRLPLLLISPYAKPNYVKHTANDQTSILRFIEDNWGLERIDPIGHQSTDEQAATLDSMFDFSPGATRTGKLLLDPATGAAPGTERVKAPVTETPGGGGTPSPAPTPEVTPTPLPVAQPDPPKPVLGNLTLKAKLKTSKTVTVGVTAEQSPTVKTAVRVRLLKGKTVVATTSATIKSKKLTLTLKAKKAIKHGKYSLVVTVTPAGGLPTSQTKSVKL